MSMTCSQREQARRAERETALAARDAERAARSGRPAAEAGLSYHTLMHRVGVKYADRFSAAHTVAADAILDGLTPSELERIFREFIDGAAVAKPSSGPVTTSTSGDPWADVARQLAAQRAANDAADRRQRELVNRYQAIGLAALERERARGRI